MLRKTDLRTKNNWRLKRQTTFYLTDKIIDNVFVLSKYDSVKSLAFHSFKLRVNIFSRNFQSFKKRQLKTSSCPLSNHGDVNSEIAQRNQNSHSSQ